MRNALKKSVALAAKAHAGMIEEAMKAGRLAYAEGRKAPALDPAAMALIAKASPMKVDGLVLAILEAWTREWHAANLKAVGLL